MILAEVIVDGNFTTYAQEALFFLVFVGGAMFLLASVVIGQNPTSSASRPRKQSVPKDNPLGAAGVASSARQGPARAARPQHSPGVKDKRSSLRRGGNPVAVLVSDALVPGDPVDGLVLNRSRGGLCLTVPQKVEVDQLLAIRTADFPKSLSSVRLRVRHCKQMHEGWRLGCQFVDDLPWSTVLLFG